MKMSWSSAGSDETAEAAFAMELRLRRSGVLRAGLRFVARPRLTDSWNLTGLLPLTRRSVFEELEDLAHARIRVAASHVAGTALALYRLAATADALRALAVLDAGIGRVTVDSVHLVRVDAAPELAIAGVRRARVIIITGQR